MRLLPVGTRVRVACVGDDETFRRRYRKRTGTIIGRDTTDCGHPDDPMFIVVFDRPVHDGIHRIHTDGFWRGELEPLWIPLVSSQ